MFQFQYTRFIHTFAKYNLQMPDTMMPVVLQVDAAMLCPLAHADAEPCQGVGPWSIQSPQTFIPFAKTTYKSQ